MRFGQYVALGDSMSLDLYPTLDANEAGERLWSAAAVQTPLFPMGATSIAYPKLKIGAASLLHRNDDAMWPEFEGQDLRTLGGDMPITILASDGAVVADVLRTQIPGIPRVRGTTLITLTIGGNDLLHALFSAADDETLDRGVGVLSDSYARLVGGMRELIPDSLIVLTTIYDPSDGTGQVPGIADASAPLPLEYLHEMNASIRELAAEVPGTALADIHAHFLGHGVTAPEEERWYWRHSLIEPSAAGASEIRRVWLETLERCGAV
ncbi:MAG TPA: SGNH/GDSL hydrolase family protein [Gemmatimonadaceae bacterium]|nr:SGNH/GDSL hydrolase family protein [Gemmatimonadaceae bacterium]